MSTRDDLSDDEDMSTQDEMSGDEDMSSNTDDETDLEATSNMSMSTLRARIEHILRNTPKAYMTDYFNTLLSSEQNVQSVIEGVLSAIPPQMAGLLDADTPPRQSSSPHTPNYSLSPEEKQ